MDPEACILSAETALNELDFDAFRDCLPSPIDEDAEA